MGTDGAAGRDNATSSVVVIGPSMPPVHGAALVTARVASLFEDAGRRAIWVSRNTASLDRGLGYYARTVLNMLRISVIAARARRTSDVVYVACSGGLGVLAEAWCVLLARSRRASLIVHHHNFNYLVERSRVYEAVQRLLFRGATHVVLCDHMADLLVATGAPRNRIRVVSNVTTMDAPPSHLTGSTPPEPAGAPAPLRVGHLSNLSADKGLETMVELVDRCPTGIRFMLYGAPQAPSDQATLDRAIERFPDRLEAIAPTDRAAVWAFLSSIDVFVFPSRFRNEAAPLVVYEALRAGLPVIASDRGCIPSQLTPHLAEGVLPLDRFVDDASAMLAAMADDRALLDDWRTRASDQWTDLETTAIRDREVLISLIGAAASN